MRYVPAEVTWAAGTILKGVYMVMAVPKMLRYKVLFRAALSTAATLMPLCIPKRNKFSHSGRYHDIRHGWLAANLRPTDLSESLMTGLQLLQLAHYLIIVCVSANETEPHHAHQWPTQLTAISAFALSSSASHHHSIYRQCLFRANLIFNLRISEKPGGGGSKAS